jgi:hypothetical protein
VVSRPNDGGPAFPQKKRINRDGYWTDEFEPVGGMTLRDYFAAKAMHQFLAGAVIPDGYDASEALAKVSARAYEVADAMLRCAASSKS